MKKRLPVVMLPTEKASAITLGLNDMLVHTGRPVSYTQNRNDDFINQHIHIVSNAEVEVGEWGIPQCVNESFNNKPIKFLRVAENMVDCIIVTDGKEELTTTKHLFTGTYKAVKIEATSDDELGLPLIQTGDLKCMVLEHHTGNKITEVEVEMETVTGYDDDKLPMTSKGQIFNNQIKTRDDNTVILNFIAEKKLTEQEAISMIQTIYSEFAELDRSMYSPAELKRIIEIEIEKHPKTPLKIFNH